MTKFLKFSDFEKVYEQIHTNSPIFIPISNNIPAVPGKIVYNIKPNEFTITVSNNPNKYIRLSINTEPITSIDDKSNKHVASKVWNTYYDHSGSSDNQNEKRYVQKSATEGLNYLLDLSINYGTNALSLGKDFQRFFNTDILPKQSTIPAEAFVALERLSKSLTEQQLMAYGFNTSNNKLLVIGLVKGRQALNKAVTPDTPAQPTSQG